MCGITGIYYSATDHTVDRATLKKMTDAVQHRGPDAEGFYVEKNIGLGHRRLSIIDLGTGDQPMVDPDTQNVLIYNGEIYNYVELRAKLKKLGHSFRTESDTEVILKAYAEWGTNCLDRFNGMWAFAIWDHQRRRLFVARDRLGIKPLYFFHDGGKFVFGSEIKSIAAEGVPTELNFELLDIYLTLGYIPAPYSFYKNIHKLKPGHHIVVQGKTVTTSRFWDVPWTDESAMKIDAEDVYETFESLFQDAVRIRMRSDVPFGAFLSGGLDSASIVTTMSGYTDVPVETFTIGFENPEFDESHLAKLVAAQQKTNHHVETVTPNLFDDALNQVADHHDEPFGDSSAIPTGLVSQFAAKHVKMVLTGDGGDEVLSGYPSFQVEKFVKNYQKLPNALMRAIPGALHIVNSVTPDRFSYSLNRYERLLRTSQYSFKDRLLTKIAWLEEDRRNQLLKNYEVIPMADFFDDFMKECPYKDSFYKLQFYHFRMSLPEDMLTKVDRMSMAHSLEARVPFLDHRLVEYMSGVHKNVKLQGAMRKSVLRNTIGKKLPSALLKSPKSGFSVPLREWFKDDGFTNRLDDLVNADWKLDRAQLDTIISDNRSGKKDYGNLIWMLFLLRKEI